MNLSDTLSSARRRAGGGSLMRQRTLWAYVFISAPLVGLFVFFLGPILFSGWVSLHNWNMIAPVAEMEWRGLDNYIYLLTEDNVFPLALLNTFLFAIGGVVSNVVIGLSFALLLNSQIRLRTVWRVLYFLPVMTAPLALGVLFGFLFNRNYGLVNNLLVGLGLPRQAFLVDPNQALLVIIFIAIYQYVGYYIVIYLAGLQGIPQDYYDAAAVDGASRWQSFWRITLPLLAPTSFFLAITGVIGSLQVFTPVYVLTKGGPLDSTNTAVFHIYRRAFQEFDFGYAAAQSWILFAVIFAVTIVQVGLRRREEIQY